MPARFILHLTPPIPKQLLIPLAKEETHTQAVHPPFWGADTQFTVLVNLEGGGHV